MNDHKARYKNSGLDAKELRRRREKDSVQLRKQKRDDILCKRRTLAQEPSRSEVNTDNEEISEDRQEFPESVIDNSITGEVIAAILQDNDSELLLENAQKVRKILSKEPQPPFEQVIESGLIPRFVQLLDRHDNTNIQFEVAWILTNICSGTSDQTSAVVKHDAVPKLVSLISSPDQRVCEQVIWALGNIIGDGAEFRDLVIRHNFIPGLLAFIRPDLDLNFLRNVTWVIVNLCRNKEPPPESDVIQQLLPALGFLIQSTDLLILIDTTWAISYITELGPSYCQLIIDYGLLSRITPLLRHEEMKIKTAAIRALGSIVTGSDAQTQAVIDAGALKQIELILETMEERVSKELLWLLSNITAGSTEQIQAVIDNNLLKSIVWFLDRGDYNTQREAAWTIYNMCLSGTPTQLQHLIELDAIRPICNCLSLKDVTIVRNALESLSCILNVCLESNPKLRDIIEECGGLDKIELLQSNQNQEVYEFAYNIIDKFFND